MDITGWNKFYKYKDGELETTNVLYTPYVNPEGTVMCMSWDETDSYQEFNKLLTKELIDFFFEREVTYLMKFQEFDWAPRVLAVDRAQRRVFIEWNKETLNTIIHTGRSLDELCPSWKDEIFTILQDIVNSGTYKMALYPHCFFIAADGTIKVFDFYSCLSIEERYLSRSTLAGLIGPESGGRFDEATIDDKVDFAVFFKNTLNNQLAKTWPDNPFPEFYKRLFPDVQV